MQTIEDARAYLAKNAMEGARCPCCNQMVKLYRRPLTRNMAKVLLEFYRGARHGDGWLHIRRDVFRGHAADGEHAKLRYWGLLEERQERSGYWRITERGKQFVEGQILMPRVALVLNGQVLALDRSKQVSFYDVLGKHFDFKEVWGDESVGGVRQ